MPKLRIDDDELPDDLDDVEYDRSRRDYEKYSGPQPPKDTFLLGYVKSVWWTETNGGDRMLKVLWIADGNKGKDKQYNGLDVWENLALTAAAKFKWGPFFEYFGLSIKMLKTQTIMEADEDNIGVPIKKIGKKFVPGEECRVAIITSREKYNDNWQTHAAEWLDEDEAEDEDELEDELDEEELDDEEGEEEDEEPEEDEEDEPEPPRRPTARKPAAASTTKTSARPRAAASPSAKSAPAKAPARPARPAAKAPAKPAARASARPASTKRRSAAVDDDPPF